MKPIYLDYAATMPLAPEAKAVIEQFTARDDLGNPSSLHSFGRAAQSLLDQAHTTVGAIFGVQPTEVIFTSGATEANNLAIRGVLQAWRNDHKTKPHVVLSAIEHPSWRTMPKAEDADVTLVPVSPGGVVSAEAVLAAMQPTTALVGCMYVNNEIGTVQPVAAIGKAIRERRGRAPWPVFHIDAVQAFPYLNTHIGHTHADMMTFSGHKYGALGGIGVLIAKKQVPLASTVLGGAQEWGYRAGTENVLGALTVAAVMEWNDAHRDELVAHARSLQTELETALPRLSPKIKILGHNVERAPHITYFWVPGVTDEHLVHKLDLVGVAVSSGSACSSGAMLPSATLIAMGFSDDEAFGGLRVSYGRFTKKEEIKEFCATIETCLG